MGGIPPSESTEMVSNDITEPLRLTLPVFIGNEPVMTTAKCIIFNRCLHNEFDTKLPVVTLAHATEQCVLAVLRNGNQVTVLFKNELNRPGNRGGWLV